MLGGVTRHMLPDLPGVPGLQALKLFSPLSDTQSDA